MVLLVLGLQLLPVPIAIGIASFYAIMTFFLGKGYGVLCGFLKTGALQYLGKWSYVLYLIHLPILIIFSYYRHEEISTFPFSSLGNNFEGGLDRIDILPTPLLVIFLSALLHHFFEEPIRKRLVSKFNKTD